MSLFFRCFWFAGVRSDVCECHRWHHCLRSLWPHQWNRRHLWKVQHLAPRGCKRKSVQENNNHCRYQPPVKPVSLAFFYLINPHCNKCVVCRVPGEEVCWCPGNTDTSWMEWRGKRTQHKHINDDECSKYCLVFISKLLILHTKFSLLVTDNNTSQPVEVVVWCVLWHWRSFVKSDIYQVFCGIYQ